MGLDGLLSLPKAASGIVLFAHGSGSSRLSPRNTYVAEALQEAGLATLLFDLLTEPEAADRARVFDIPLLADRLAMATEWTATQPETVALAIGYFGASTGAAAALVAAARSERDIAAVVSRGGRPDLADAELARVRAPTLLIVGGADDVVLDLNRMALAQLTCEKKLSVVPGATHLFEEPGTLDEVIDLAQSWFVDHFPAIKEDVK
jgi:dienelactone hydrolase